MRLATAASPPASSCASLLADLTTDWSPADVAERTFDGNAPLLTIAQLDRMQLAGVGALQLLRCASSGRAHAGRLALTRFDRVVAAFSNVVGWNVRTE